MITLNLTKDLVALLDDEDAHVVGDYSWYATTPRNGKAYAARRKSFGRGKQAIVLLHREIMQPGPGLVVDHINGDSLDNRRANLRVVRQATNIRNVVGPRRDGSSPYLGVVRFKRRWCAQIKVDGRNKVLGYFDTPEAANVARLTAEREAIGIQPRRAQAFMDAGFV